MKKFGVLVVLVFICFSAFSAVWYVDCTQPDNRGDGTTRATAKRTLQAAVDASVAGDTILAAPGVYNEGTRITPGKDGWLQNRLVINSDITLESEQGAEKTVICGILDNHNPDFAGCGSNAVRCVYATAGTIKGFTLTGGASGNLKLEDANNRGGGIYVPRNNQSVLISDCIISNNVAMRGGGVYGGTLQRCWIIDNTAHVNGAGLRDARVYDSVIAFNQGSGAAFCYYRSGYCDNGIYNSTVAYNQGTALEYSSGFNTIVVGNGTRLVSGSPDNIKCVNCCFAGAVPPQNLIVDSMVVNNAQLADPFGYDFRLLQNSPCLDTGSLDFTGNITENELRMDLLGNPRITNNKVNIGAIEGCITNVAVVGFYALDGNGTIEPAETTRISDLPAKIRVKAIPNQGFSLVGFTTNGVVVSKTQDWFELIISDIGAYTVNAMFEKSQPYDNKVVGMELMASPEYATVVEGRLEGQTALLIEAGAQRWSCKPYGNEYFVEFWFKPINWNSATNERIPLSHLAFGKDLCEVVKCAEKSQIELLLNGKTVAVTPIYAWDFDAWKPSRKRNAPLYRSIGWHHLCVMVSNKVMRVGIDGFAMRETEEPITINGVLEELALRGEPGTMYSLPFINRQKSLKAVELRQRFLALYTNSTQIKTPLLFASHAEVNPVIDGKIADNEWSKAIVLRGWNSKDGRQVLNSGIVAYLSYTKGQVNLAFVMPDIEEKTDLNQVEVLLGLPFVIGEKPQQMYCFYLDKDGQPGQYRILPTYDKLHNIPWTVAAGKNGKTKVIEISLPFKELGMPQPIPGEVWNLGISMPQKGVLWSMPGAKGELPVAELQFDPSMPVIQLRSITLDTDTALVSLDLFNLRENYNLTVNLWLYEENDLVPSSTLETPIPFKDNAATKVELVLPIGGCQSGTIALGIRADHKNIFYHHIKFFAADKVGIK